MSEEKNWKSVGSDGEIEFIKPKELAENNMAGKVIVEGVYRESIMNKFDKTDFKFETEDGKIVILNGAGNLSYRMKSINPGDLVRVQYDGQQELSSGKYKGSLCHNFSVFIAE